MSEEQFDKLCEKLDNIVVLLEEITHWTEESGSTTYPGALTHIRKAIEGQ